MKVLLFLTGFTAIILVLALRGIPGNITSRNLNSPSWTENGPFELSVERGRFALGFSLAENKSFQFSLPVAHFAVPDLGYKDGRYVSLFAPGLSFLILPGFVLGRLFEFAQIGAYSTISLFALGNLYLVYLISRRLDASPSAAALAGLAFLFASPAFPYAVSLYQHHISTFLLLLSTFCLLKSSRIWSLAVVSFCLGLAFTVDYPNALLFLPLVIYGFFSVFKFHISTSKISLKADIVKTLAVLAIVPPLLLLAYSNWKSYGNPFQLAGTVPGVRAIDERGKPAIPQAAVNTTQNLEKFVHPELQQKTVVKFFRSRNLLNGLYVLLVSPDRGLVVYAPILLLAITGGYLLYRQNNQYFPVLLGVILVDLVLYSLWGDPWGGWAFGSRYLIPGYAFMAILSSLAFDRWRKKLIFLFAALVLFVYSVAVNTMGALTSNANPPHIEILALEKISGKQEKYTWERNWDFLMTNGSKSFVFQTYVKNYMTAPQYFYLISWAIVSAVILLTYRLYNYDHP